MQINIVYTIKDTYSYTDPTWLDRLTAFNGVPITYDNAGNPLSYYNGSAYTLTWQNGRELATATKNGVTSSYKYNIDGQRIQKTVGDVVYDYYYADGLLVRQTWGNNYIDFLYDESGVFSFVYNGTQYFYIKNLQGDVVAIANSNGTILVEYVYDAWGDVISVTGTEASTIGAVNPIRYRGYYYDVDTEFYYLNSRYYDPEIRRFINADDVGLIGANGDFISYNLYTYCLNNPVNRIDESGDLSWKKMLKIGISTALLGLAVLSAIPTGGGSLVLAGVGISAATATVAAQAVVATGVAISVTAVGIGLAESFNFKKSRQSGKETSSDRPSWVNSDNINSNLSPQQNAKNLLDQKYGSGNWSKGPGSEFNKIVKWIQRWFLNYKG